MWWWVAQAALAATIELPAEVSVSGEPGSSDTPACVTHDARQRCDWSGGWVRLVSASKLEELWFGPSTSVVLDAQGGASGPGAAEVRAQREVRAWVAGREPSTIDAAGRAARLLRRRAAAQPVSDELRARIVDHGTAALANRVVGATDGQVLLRDPRFYHRLSAALELRPQVVEVPFFWSFGWSYGRMAGGVR